MATERIKIPSYFDLTGRVALVTGAGGYLGSAIARGLATAGASVILNGRNENSLKKVLAEIEAQGGEARLSLFDVTDDKLMDDALEAIRAEFGQLDILVNNAYNGVGGTVTSSSRRQYNDAYDITVSSAAQLVRAALPLLRRTGTHEEATASVINIASMYGLVSPDFSIYDSPEGTNPPFYGAAKAGLIQLSRYQACQLAGEGIRVNALCPGPFPAPHVQNLQPAFVEKLNAKVPLGRIGQADELIGPVIFLASDASSYMTGATLPIDGGWTSS